MLIALSIQKFALVDSLYLEFTDGLNILTGETGAGKSIVISALALVLGGRSNKEMIMSGSQQATVEASFRLSCEQITEIEKMGFPAEEVVSLQRIIKTSGSSTCRINGKIIPLSILKDIGALLLEIHGQHENQLLFDKKNHLQFLDGFGEDELTKLQEDYLTAYLHYGKLKKKMISSQMNPEYLAKRKEELEKEINEFAKLKWQEGEEELLNQEVARLSNFELINSNLEKAYSSLYEIENSVLSGMNEAISAMENIKEIGNEYSDSFNKLNETYYTLEDITLFIRETKSSSGFSQIELENTQKRLFDFAKLKKRLGDEQQVLDYFSRAQKELDEISDRIENAKEYKQQLKDLFEDAKIAAQKLSDQRKKVSLRLSQELLAQMYDLGMEKAQFEVEFLRSKNLSKTGFDEVEFLFSANAGEPVRPMTKVASGGEISRLMLALKNIDIKHSRIDSMVFDEIDTGISGKMAQAVAEKLANISKEDQVICVTHLPQVAAMSDRHFLVAKNEQDGKARVCVSLLENEDKINEMARLISGKQITQTGLDHAKELLALARDYKLAK